MSEVDRKPTSVTEEKQAPKLPAYFNGQVPAYPITGPCEAMADQGLTKRELFAAMAMQGAMYALAIQADEFAEDEPVDPQPIARDAVRMADALLKELAK